jgi:hypothetical protein
MYIRKIPHADIQGRLTSLTNQWWRVIITRMLFHTYVFGECSTKWHFHRHVFHDVGFEWTRRLECAPWAVTHVPKFLIWKFYTLPEKIPADALVQVFVVLIWSECETELGISSKFYFARIAAAALHSYIADLDACRTW